MGAFDFLKKTDPADLPSQEDVIIENWLEEKELNWFEDLLGEEIGAAGTWPGAKDKLQQVIIGSISPEMYPIRGGDLAEEMSTMPEELRAEVINRVYDLMRNPEFADIGGIADIGIGDIAEGLINWRSLYGQIKSELGGQNLLHLATGDIMSTEWGKFDPILLYRGQNLAEAAVILNKSNESTLREMADVYKGYERNNIKPFTGDLPAMFLGLHDPGEYWDESTDLPKSFTGFDDTKPVYDISNEIGIRIGNVGHLSDQEYQNVDHPEYGDQYFGQIQYSEVDDALSALQDLKSGKIKATSIRTLGLSLHTSIDLGTYVKSVGYDQESEQYYVSATDIWDFNKSGSGGNYDKWGPLSPSIEGVGEGVQMYGRVYIDEQELLDNIIVSTDSKGGNYEIISRLSVMMENERLK